MTETRFPWLLTGTVVGRGPDCEPLLVDVSTVALLDRAVVTDAETLYHQVFDVGKKGT